MLHIFAWSVILLAKNSFFLKSGFSFLSLLGLHAHEKTFSERKTEGERNRYYSTEASYSIVRNRLKPELCSHGEHKLKVGIWSRWTILQPWSGFQKPIIIGSWDPHFTVKSYETVTTSFNDSFHTAELNSCNRNPNTSIFI